MRMMSQEAGKHGGCVVVSSRSASPKQRWSVVRRDYNCCEGDSDGCKQPRGGGNSGFQVPVMIEGFFWGLKFSILAGKISASVFRVA